MLLHSDRDWSLNTAVCGCVCCPGRDIGLGCGGSTLCTLDSGTKVALCLLIFWCRLSFNSHTHTSDVKRSEIRLIPAHWHHLLRLKSLHILPLSINFVLMQKYPCYIFLLFIFLFIGASFGKLKKSLSLSRYNKRKILQWQTRVLNQTEICQRGFGELVRSIPIQRFQCCLSYSWETHWTCLKRTKAPQIWREHFKENSASHSSKWDWESHMQLCRKLDANILTGKDYTSHILQIMSW